MRCFVHRCNAHRALRKIFTKIFISNFVEILYIISSRRCAARTMKEVFRGGRMNDVFMVAKCIYEQYAFTAQYRNVSYICSISKISNSLS